MKDVRSRRLSLLFGGLVCCAACSDDDSSRGTGHDADVGVSDVSGDAASDADATRDAATDAPADAVTDAPIDSADTHVGTDATDDPDTTDTTDTTHTTDAGDADGDATHDTSTGTPRACDALICGDGTCDESAGTCACVGTWFDGNTCAPFSDCGDACDCPVPTTATLSPTLASDVLTFSGADAIRVGVATALEATAPDAWTDATTVDLSAHAGTRVRVFARSADAACDDGPMFNHVFDVRDAFPGPAETDGSTAVGADDPAIIAWANTVLEADLGDEVDDEWRDADAALGPAVGTSFDIVSLGRGGSVTLGFDPPIRDGSGDDLVVFENGFSDSFLELAYVEVSSDGVTFVRFDAASTDESDRGAFDVSDPETIGQLAGTYRQGWGTPFDLARLRQHPAVRAGALDLHAVSAVRVVDVVGDGRETDAFGRTIRDPYPTSGSVGFDLDAVGALHVAEP